MPIKKKIKSPQQLWESFSSIFVTFVEGVFFSLGVLVARHPWKTIMTTWVFVILSCCGLFTFSIEKNPMNLWVPPDSDFYYDTHWYIEKFGTNFRFQKLLITAENVLDPSILKLASEITNRVNMLNIDFENKTYAVSELCFKVPIVTISTESNWKPRSEHTLKGNNKTRHGLERYEIHFSDPYLWIDDDFYCGLLSHFPLSCLRDNVLDIWNNDKVLIDRITRDDVINKINTVKINPITGHPIDYAKLLGGVVRNETHDIVAAKSLLLTWYMHVDMSKVNLNEVGNLIGTEDWVSIPLALWEKEFLNYAHSLSVDKTGYQLFYEAGRSFADISGEAMFQEIDKLFIGIIAMFFYVVFAVSRFNWLELRLILGSIGLLNVGMAYITAVSLCSLVGIPFGPVHSSLPFLFMGLGVDDMFVMNACWKIVLNTDSHKSTPIKVGLMLKHAGVSIVITSFTDIVALLIGAITILPSLKSFCIYAAVGVFFIFCYSITFYVAVFTLDLRRIEQNRNGMFFCYKHKKEIALTNDTTFSQKFLKYAYKNIILTIPGKVTIILFTLIMTGVSIQGMLKLEQRFDPKWFIPDDTYYKEFLDTHEYYYPEEGHPAMVFLGDMNYNLEFKNLYEMVQVLKNESYVSDVISWVEIYHGYVLRNFGTDLLNTSILDSQFKKYLSIFLFSPVGGRFKMNFKFSDQVSCRHNVSDILASTFSFRFIRFEGPAEYIPAMNQVKHIIGSTNITTGSGYRSVWSKVFGNWVTDEIIAEEVERNIELALLCVMVCTFILITNLQMCLWIFICVLLTIVNVLGWMQRWGMTVDIVCCIGLELAIGLCVDYAAHVGHTFLTITQGSRNARALKTVTSIGSAVLLGGGATLLSLSLLSMSKAYTFQSFFKIFLLVILFGVFNGLFFLPTVLSLIGPAGYRVVEKEIPPEAVELNGKICDKEKKESMDDI